MIRDIGRPNGILARFRAFTQRNHFSSDALPADPLDEFLPEVAPVSQRTPRAIAAWPPSRRHIRPAAAVAIIGVAILAGIAVYGARATSVATGFVRIESDPGNAAVRMDGRVLGTTPLTVSLPLGPHQLTIEQGGRVKPVSVNVSAETTAVHHVELPPLPAASAVDTGTLQVTSPGAAAVTVDGKQRGMTPLTLAGLTAGEHQVVVRSDGTSYRRTIQVEPGKTVSLVLGDLGERSPGWLSVQTPLPFTIAEGGQVVGTTASRRVMLPAGDHTFEFISEPLGFRETQRVRIDPDRVTTLTLRLPLAPLQINASPWAEVWIDGERVGETPLANVMQTIGPHEIVFRHPQLGERRMTTMVALGAPARATVDMRAR